MAQSRVKAPASQFCPTGRGRGHATNVPERALIAEVRVRPVLYDKSQKEYRKVRVFVFKLFSAH